MEKFVAQKETSQQLLGTEFQGMSVAHQPQPVSPSEVVDIDHRKNDKLFGDHVDRSYQKHLPRLALGATTPQDSQGYSPASPMMQQRTETVGVEVEGRQEKEEIDHAFGVGKKKSVKKTQKRVIDLRGENILKCKNNKGKGCSAQKKSKSGVLLPGQTLPRVLPLPTTTHDVYETIHKEFDDCLQHHYHTGNTCKVSEQEFTDVFKQLPENHQDDLRTFHYAFHPMGGADCEGHGFKSDYCRLPDGMFGAVLNCQDKMPKEKWSKAKNKDLVTLKGHPDICKLQGMKQESGMEGITDSLGLEEAGMSLVQFVMNRPEKETLSQELIWDLMKQALKGLSMLHSMGIIHLDIKPENLSIQDDNKGCYVLTITNFRSARREGQEMDFVGWTPEYMAPELCRCYLQFFFKNEIFSSMNNQITGKVDVFALGLAALFLHEKKHVLLNFLTGGQNSYRGLPLENIKCMRLELLLYLARMEDPFTHIISNACTTYMRDVLSSMLSGSADLRPTAEEALAYMTARIQEVEQTVSLPAAPRPGILVPQERITQGRHHFTNLQCTIDNGGQVTQPSPSSKITEVPVYQLSLPKTINSLLVNESDTIKDHLLKQRLREKLNTNKRTKLCILKEIEARNQTPKVVKQSSSVYIQSPVDHAASKMESCKRDIGHNIVQAEQLGITHPYQISDTTPVQPSSHTGKRINMMDLYGNIPNFDVLDNI